MQHHSYIQPNQATTQHPFLTYSLMQSNLILVFYKHQLPERKTSNEYIQRDTPITHFDKSQCHHAQSLQLAEASSPQSAPLVEPPLLVTPLAQPIQDGKNCMLMLCAKHTGCSSSIYLCIFLSFIMCRVNCLCMNPVICCQQSL